MLNSIEYFMPVSFISFVLVVSSTRITPTKLTTCNVKTVSHYVSHSTFYTISNDEVIIFFIICNWFIIINYIASIWSAGFSYSDIFIFMSKRLMEKWLDCMCYVQLRGKNKSTDSTKDSPLVSGQTYWAGRVTINATILFLIVWIGIINISIYLQCIKALSIGTKTCSFTSVLFHLSQRLLYHHVRRFHSPCLIHGILCFWFNRRFKPL